MLRADHSSCSTSAIHQVYDTRLRMSWSWALSPGTRHRRVHGICLTPDQSLACSYAAIDKVHTSPQRLHKKHHDSPPLPRSRHGRLSCHVQTHWHEGTNAFKHCRFCELEGVYCPRRRHTYYPSFRGKYDQLPAAARIDLRLTTINANISQSAEIKKQNGVA